MEKQLVLSLFILFYATISLADPEVTTVQSINGPMTKTVAQGAVTYCFVSHAGMISPCGDNKSG